MEKVIISTFQQYLDSSFVAHSRKINLIIGGTNQGVIFEKEEEEKRRNSNSYSRR